MGIGRNLRDILKEYCLNSSLAGLSYIANKKYHYTERLFWLFCFLLSMSGSYYLIINFMETYSSNSISMVVENVNPQDVTYFPSVGICEMGYSKELYSRLEDIIEGMRLNEDMDYNYDVEDFLLRVVFHNLYNYGSITSYCAPYRTCDDCIRCPLSNYQLYADKVRANCSELFAKCYYNEKEFNCCDYFKPLKTSMGVCYIINSIHVSKKNTKEWKLLPVGLESGPGHLRIEVLKSTSLYILNDEDIPHMLLQTLYFPQIPEGFEGLTLLALQNTVNDEGVHNIDPIQRKCYFPEEDFPTKYKYYSYSVCVTECLKRAQLRTCNCSHHNMIFDEHDPTPVCDYDGLYCLDQSDLMYPQTTMMQPWRVNGLLCHCFPSCNEHEIKIVGRTSKLIQGRQIRAMSIRLQQLPNQRYRRQAVREQLDVVVSIGGILGLFMGASILSLVEFIYFFTVRALGNYCQRKNVLLD